MTNLKMSLILITCLIIFTHSAEAGKTHALVVLKFPVSARACGMGEVGVSCPDGIDSVFFNPAGLSLIEDKELSLFYSTILDIKHGFIGYAQKVKENITISMSFATLQVGDIEINYENRPGKKVKAESDYVACLSSGLKLTDNLLIGVNLKKIQSELVEEVKAKASAMDFGALLLISENLSLGVVGQNFGSYVTYREKEDPLPFNIRLGASYKFQLSKESKAKALYSSAHSLEYKPLGLSSYADILLGVDLVKYKGDTTKVHLGVEYLGIEKDLNMYLRLGYEFGYDTKGLTAGIGFVERGYSLDYAYLHRDELDKNHYISLGVKF